MLKFAFVEMFMATTNWCSIKKSYNLFEWYIKNYTSQIHRYLQTQSIIKVPLDDTTVIKYSIITVTWIRCRILCKISCHPFLKIFVNLILNVCSFINTCINVNSLVTEPLYLEEDIIKMFWHRKGEIVSSPVPWGVCKTCRIYWQTHTLV